jgi:uncharacterized protein YbaP (TraB family)
MLSFSSINTAIIPYDRNMTAVVPYDPNVTNRGLFITQNAQRYLLQIETEAMKYLGNRTALRREVKINPARITILEAQTVLMSRIARYRGFLWSVEFGNCKSYFFGASHMSMRNFIKPSHFFHPIVLQKFTGSSDLFVELVLGRLSPSESKNLEAACQSRKIRQTDFLSETTRRICETATTCLGLDTALMALAPQYGIKMHSLETVEEQIDFGNIRPSTIEKTDSLPPYGEIDLDCINAIQSGNLEQVNECLSEELKEIVIGLEKRNERIAPRVIKILEQGVKGFFALGAQHFVGNMNILTLISRDPRFKFTRVDLP